MKYMTNSIDRMGKCQKLMWLFSSKALECYAFGRRSSGKRFLYLAKMKGNRGKMKMQVAKIGKKCLFLRPSLEMLGMFSLEFSLKSAE